MSQRQPLTKEQEEAIKNHLMKLLPKGSLIEGNINQNSQTGEVDISIKLQLPFVI